MYKQDLALNDPKGLICHKTQPNQKYYPQNVLTNHIKLIYMYKQDLALNDPKELICHKTQPNQKYYPQNVLTNHI